MDFYKAYDFLAVKFEAYEFDKTCLKLIHSYFSNLKQQTKTNSSYSHWDYIFRGLLQGSILCLLLFNLFFNDLTK